MAGSLTAKVQSYRLYEIEIAKVKRASKFYHLTKSQIIRLMIAEFVIPVKRK